MSANFQRINKKRFPVIGKPFFLFKVNITFWPLWYLLRHLYLLCISYQGAIFFYRSCCFRCCFVFFKSFVRSTIFLNCNFCLSGISNCFYSLSLGCNDCLVLILFCCCGSCGFGCLLLIQGALRIYFSGSKILRSLLRRSSILSQWERLFI